jgi:methylmalonyl-CoA epimerase
MVLKLDHVGIAVTSIDRSLRFWRHALGLELIGRERVETEGVEVACLGAGTSRIELVQPLGADTPVGRFLGRRGQGMHHLTLQVDHLDRVLAGLGQRGVEVLGQAPRTGAGGSRVAFLSPRSTGGVLVELVQHGPGDPRDIVPGDPVLLYLREPQEKLWGVLRKIDTTGVVLEGIDLSSFDDWVAQVERGEDSIVGPSVMFLPIGRLEKILLDRSSGGLPSLAERFLRRIGRTVQQVLEAAGAADRRPDEG